MRKYLLSILTLATITINSSNTAKAQPNLSQTELSCIYMSAYSYNINPLLLLAIAKTESGFNRYAINKNKNGTIDYGMFQINSSNLKRLKIHPSYVINDVCFASKIAAYILSSCIATYGNTWKAVDCYNKGKNAKNTSEYVWKTYKNLISLLNQTPEIIKTSYNYSQNYSYQQYYNYYNQNKNTEPNIEEKISEFLGIDKPQ
ncbi:MAG: lytic transglycosylase domain-containing protein [Sulfurihydrogenibium sp.]|jgi:soluble lytic murein transglycosylase-like protein|nr:lytic transglycosylase domain-containing protein [Sulfurihydrogenibium sp.]